MQLTTLEPNEFDGPDQRGDIFTITTMHGMPGNAVLMDYCTIKQMNRIWMLQEIFYV